MGLTEYALLILVILVPFVIATAVTMWTLEQARLRSKKNRGSRSPETDTSPPPSTAA